MTSPPIDPVILQRAIEGDPEACALLVERYEKLVTNVVQRVLGPHHPNVRDAFQETFAKALRALRRGGFDPNGPAAFSTWLATVAKRAAIDQRRFFDHRGRVVGIDPEPIFAAQPDLGPSPEDEIWQQRWLWGAIEALPAGARPVVMGRLAGQDDDSIAAQLGISKNNLRIRLSRALERLEHLGRKWKEEN